VKFAVVQGRYTLPRFGRSSANSPNSTGIIGRSRPRGCDVSAAQALATVAGPDTAAQRRVCQSFITAGDGVRLAYTDHGDATARCTVTILHGLCLPRGSRTRHISYLARRYSGAVRVVSYDHRGAGTPSRPWPARCAARTAEANLREKLGWDTERGRRSPCDHDLRACRYWAASRAGVHGIELQVWLCRLRH